MLVSKRIIESVNSAQKRLDKTSNETVTGSTPALFLDRDGVIIENRANYVRSWDDVAIYPQALQALARARHWPGKIIVVTNQSVVGRGLIALQTAEAINTRLLHEIQNEGGRIDAVYMCPHAPQDNCACRKPRPGLLLQAADALDLDMAQSLMIGDALSDIAAGRAAGAGAVALLQTGRGRQQLQSSEAAAVAPFPVFADLSQALEQLLSVESPHEPETFNS